MPEQSFNIGYGLNDFFHDSGNVQLMTTVPFDKGNLIAWAKTKDSSVNQNGNLFDADVTQVVFNGSYKTDFINNYLPGNIIINGTNDFSDFNTRITNVTNTTNNSSSENSYSLVQGDITLNPSTSPITYNFSLNDVDKSSIKYKKDGSMDISSIYVDNNSSVEQEYTETAGQGGGSITSHITNNSANPRCKYRNNCTTNHWHYKSCTTQTFHNPDGTTYCRCVCNGPRVKNNESHSHCSPYDVHLNNGVNGVNGVNGSGSNNLPDNVTLTKALSNLIKEIKISVKPNKTTSAVDATTTKNFNFAYNNSNILSENDSKIRTLLYDYYFELNRNIQLRDLIIKNDSIDSTAKQALLDANVKYKKEYLQLFNIFSGIFFVSGYIYLMIKK